MSARYELHAHRALESPVLLLALESWGDAGFGAQGAIAAILEMMPTELLATFNADEFIDFRARRPTARISDGVLAGLQWPDEPNSPDLLSGDELAAELERFLRGEQNEN